MPWVSLGIAGACLAVHLVVGLHVDHNGFDLCKVPAKGLLQIGWLSGPFAHDDWPHLLWNLFYFALCAPFLEDVWGHRVFLRFYLAAGVLAGLPSFLALAGQPIHMLGASGAICACLGAFTWRFGRRRMRFFWSWSALALKPTFTVPAWLWGLAGFAGDALGFFLWGHGGGIGYATHVTGFLLGVGAAVCSSHLRLEDRLLASEGGWRRSHHVGRAEAALLAQRPEAAEGHLLAALRERPADTSARLALTELALQAGRPDDALAHLERLASAPAVQPGPLRQLVEALGLARLRPATALLLAGRFEPTDHLFAVELADAAALAGGRLGALALVTGAEISVRNREFQAARARAARALGSAGTSPALRARAAAVEATSRARLEIRFEEVG